MASGHVGEGNISDEEVMGRLAKKKWDTERRSVRGVQGDAA